MSILTPSYTKKDWELEKDSILSQAREHLNYIEDLKMKQEQDRLKFEHEKHILLCELNEKNKLIQNLQRQHQLEIEVICNNAEKERKLKSEHERRILGFHTIKPNSPPTSPINTSFIQPDEEQYLAQIKELQETVSQLTHKHEDMELNESRLKHLLLLENADMLMRAEARLDNLAIEHEQNIHDIEEAHQLEQQRLRKQHRNELDRLVLDFEKKIETIKKDKHLVTKKYSDLKREHKSALQIGKELVSTTLPENEQYDKNCNLEGLLRIAFGNVTNLRSRSTIMLDQSSYMPSFY